MAEAKATPAEEVAPARDGDENTLDIPGASSPTQSNGDHSSEDSPVLVGDDDITIILQAIKHVSNAHFSRPRAPSALKHENPFFYNWRGFRSRAQEIGQPETPALTRFRIKAVSFMEAAKSVYLRYQQISEHGPNTYSTVWNEFADAVVEQVQKAEPNFARAPMVPERPRRPRREEAGVSGASVTRVPTPPPPPSGSAVTANLPTPPPGPTMAE
eukprot:3416748-Pyramimonas_sp.AAC.1